MGVQGHRAGGCGGGGHERVGAREHDERDGTVCERQRQCQRRQRRAEDYHRERPLLLLLLRLAGHCFGDSWISMAVGFGVGWVGANEEEKAVEGSSSVVDREGV